MKAILLAAGQSKRMAPLPDKNFLSVCGRPLIVHQIEQLKRCGFKDVIVIGGRHNLAELRGVAKNVLEQKRLEEGMAGAVMSAEHNIKNEPFLVVSSNDVIEDSAYKALLKCKTSALLAKKVTSYFPGGYLKVAKNGSVQKIIEKPGAGNEPSDLVNIVAHLHRDPKALFQALKNTKTTRDDRYEVALGSMISAGVKIAAMPYTGVWQAIKYPWHLLAAWRLFFASVGGQGRQKISKKAQISKTAIIRSDVIIEDGVKVFDHAVIQGPAYIGRNSIVANNAMVRESHVGENCVVGFSTEVARSFLANGVWTHSNYVGDSVIGANTSFGAGAVTANLRLDEKNVSVNVNGERVDTGSNKFGIITGESVRVGVNTSIMPGVKIGNNSFVASGICVSEDIEDKQFVFGRWQLEKRENRTELEPSAREKMMERMKRGT